jgi:transposase
MRNIDKRAAEIQEALRADYLEAPRAVVEAYGEVARSSVALIEAYTRQIVSLEASLAEHFEQHPDAKVVLSLPGLGTVLGARVLGEFGDDRTRYSPLPSLAKLRRHVTDHQGLGSQQVVLARFARNNRLG